MTQQPTRDAIASSTAVIRRAHPAALPEVAMILGSGLSSVAEAISEPTVISYGDLPGFPRPSVEGHAGRLVIGKLDGAPVICLQGRVHHYEGAGLAPMLVLVRCLKRLGVGTLILTNAAGSLDPDMGPGSLMVIADHINFAGVNPLVGPNDDAYGPRFPDMSEAYDAGLRQGLHAAGKATGTALHEGVYVMVGGPNFETPAEIRAFRGMGADAVGMSTVPECLVARHCGMKVAAVSTITNLASGLSAVPLTHDETMDVGNRAAAGLAKVLAALVAGLAAE